MNQVRRTPLDHFNSKEDTAQLLRLPAAVDRIVRVAQGIVGEATIDELAAILQRLLSRRILSAQGSSDNVAVRVPLLAEWLRARGRRELEAEFEQFTRAGGAKRTITAGDLVELKKDLIYAGSPYNELQLQAWIEQFGEDLRDRHLAFLLLRRLIKEGYFPHDKIRRAILPKIANRIHTEVPELQFKQGYIANALIVSHGALGSSAPMIVTNFRTILKVKKDNCVPIEGVRDRLRLARIQNPVLILVDDFAGTGRQLATSMTQCRLASGFGDYQYFPVVAGVRCMIAGHGGDWACGGSAE